MPNAVELSPATDDWMRGDRYGTILARVLNDQVLVQLDKSRKIKWFKNIDIYAEFTR